VYIHHTVIILYVWSPDPNYNAKTDGGISGPTSYFHALYYNCSEMLLLFYRCQQFWKDNVIAVPRFMEQDGQPKQIAGRQQYLTLAADTEDYASIAPSRRRKTTGLDCTPSFRARYQCVAKDRDRKRASALRQTHLISVVETDVNYLPSKTKATDKDTYYMCIIITRVVEADTP